MKISITVNGKATEHDVEPRTLLVHYIRETLQLTGTNVGCDTSSCGACTVHLNGEAVKSCTILAAQALLEEVRYDGDGNPITSNFADYAFISAAELPSFEVIHMETPTPRNVLGAKGIGESGTIGSTPAVQSAVIDALAHLGVRHIDMPTTAERVWSEIQKQKAKGN